MAFENAEREAENAKVKLQKLNDEKSKLDDLKKKSPNKVNPIREEELKKEIPEVKAKADAAKKKADDAKKEWEAERDKNEPAKVKSYRNSLAHCEHVRQIYDPWFMDDNSRDTKPAIPNEQRKPVSGKGKSNEEIHADHLHITVVEDKILKPKE